ncbi:hypothetical protein F5J12DRAFT_954779 [Pisolithus orientalis]|uniref:uncharacterized protein n=1 Tax=Pisolithus orientalis TaxID=936130 RepID=UPI002224A551|nr:uncharacterized protein F5J12DRAFT_954779 [Pisolithus orientalis]KAI6030781.1 hypothetical protein F5J12DRAFT_954779 [Pisolithus orientalis]
MSDVSEVQGHMKVDCILWCKEQKAKLVRKAEVPKGKAHWYKERLAGFWGDRGNWSFLLSSSKIDCFRGIWHPTLENDSFDGIAGNGPQDQAMAVTEQNRECSHDETIFACPFDASEILEVNTHATNPQHVLPQPLFSPDVAGHSESQPNSAMAADCYFLPLMFFLPTTPFVDQPSVATLPPALIAVLVKVTNNLVIIIPTLSFHAVLTHSHAMAGLRMGSNFLMGAVDADDTDY